MKFCKYCKTTYESAEKAFSKCARSKDGYHYMCRACWSEYNKQRAKAEPVRVARKTCSRCRIEYLEPEKNFYNDKRARDGYQAICRICHKKYNVERRLERPHVNRNWQRSYRKQEPRRVLATKLRREYGISLEQYDDLLAAQGGRCGACSRTEPGGVSNQWHVDHEHTTRAVRGLLCHFCNTGIGLLGDDLEGLLRAVDYLKKEKVLLPSFHTRKYQRIIQWQPRNQATLSEK